MCHQDEPCQISNCFKRVCIFLTEKEREPMDLCPLFLQTNNKNSAPQNPHISTQARWNKSNMTKQKSFFRMSLFYCRITHHYWFWLDWNPKWWALAFFHPPTTWSVSHIELAHDAENLGNLFICEGLTSKDSPHTCMQTHLDWGCVCLCVYIVCSGRFRYLRHLLQLNI